MLLPLFLCAAALIDESAASVKLPPHAREVLQRVLADARLRSVRITSTERSYRRQVELMLPQFRAARAGRTELIYGGIGQELYRRYLELLPRTRRGLTARLSRELQALVESAGPTRVELSHLPGGANFAFDVAPGSAAQRRALKSALLRSPDVVRCIFPGQGSERAFHLEVARDRSPRREPGTCNDL